MICDGHGLPLAVTVGPGQEHETRQVHDLLEPVLEEDRRPKYLAGDKAYSAEWIRELLTEIGIKPVIPHKSNETA
jgi:transposase